MNNMSKKVPEDINNSYIYILKPTLTNYFDAYEPQLLKVGSTRLYGPRINVYNTSVPDNVFVLYRVQVTKLKEVDACVNKLLSKFAYRSSKEYFNAKEKDSSAEIPLMAKKCFFTLSKPS